MLTVDALLDMLWAPPYSRALRLGDELSIPMPVLLGQALYWSVFVVDSHSPAEAQLCLAVNMEDAADVRELTYTPEGVTSAPARLPMAPLPLTEENDAVEYRAMLAALQRMAEGLLNGAPPSRGDAQVFAARFLAFAEPDTLPLYQCYDGDFLRLISRVLGGGDTAGEAKA